MPIIKCPNNEAEIANCPWIARYGSVRDVPKVGIKECSMCNLVTHQQDLSDFVDYPAGSMHRWSIGYGESDLTGPLGDVARRVKSIKSLSNERPITTILDLGCGNGQMLEALKQDFEVYGIEPDDGARKIASAYGKIWNSTNSASVAGKKFDLITLFHVVEHFYNPQLEIERASRLLNPRGRIVIETPNSNDALLTHYKVKEFQSFTYWSHHPMLHSHRSLETLVKNLGLNVIENEGCQRYGLANHLYWMSHGQPGGHLIWKESVSEETSELYAQGLIQRRQCDTLWLVAGK
jgi:SAM-dependent methyltransferase